MVDSTYQKNLRTHQKGNNEYVFVSSPLDSQILFYDIHDMLSFHNQTNKNRGTHFSTLS